LHIVNKGVLEALILSGALDSLKKSRKFMMETLNDSIKEAIDFQTDKRIGQIALFEEESEENDVAPINDDEWDINEKLKREREILGFYLSGNPLDPFLRVIKRTASHNTKSLKKINLVVEERKYSSQIKVSLAGIITEINVFRGENNKKWAKIKIEDLYGDIDAFVYGGDKVDNIINSIELYKIVVTKGAYRMLQNGNKSLIADSMEDIEKTVGRDISEFHIYLKDKKVVDDELISFKNTLLSLHGSLSLYFHIKSKENKEYIVYSSDIKAPNDKEFCNQFQSKYDFIEKIRVL
ncbi:MAG TPA: hypothetical protein PK899_04280, partial [Spirochaetota bacterium]|nr:hypothetical protein [Spirochaetota bacterium]